MPIGAAAGKNMPVGALRRTVRWLWSPRDHKPEPNATCPVCAAPVVIEKTMRKGGRMGPMFSPATREEKVAACIEHGRPPFNDRTRASRS